MKVDFYNYEVKVYDYEVKVIVFWNFMCYTFRYECFFDLLGELLCLQIIWKIQSTTI